MQLTRKNIYNKAVIGVAASIWVLGLLAAGSDSLYMPWLNAVGAIVFLGASLWLGKILPLLEDAASIAVHSREASAEFPAKPRTRYGEKKQTAPLGYCRRKECGLISSQWKGFAAL